MNLLDAADHVEKLSLEEIRALLREAADVLGDPLVSEQAREANSDLAAGMAIKVAIEDGELGVELYSSPLLSPTSSTVPWPSLTGAP